MTLGSRRKVMGTFVYLGVFGRGPGESPGLRFGVHRQGLPRLSGRCVPISSQGPRW